MKRMFVLPIIIGAFLTGCSAGSINGIGGEMVTLPFSEGELVPREIVLDGEKSSIEVAAAVKPAVVGIYSNMAEGESIGSGVCVGSGGLIITNAHVVGDAENVKLYLSNDTMTGGEVVWLDEFTDVAMVRADIDLPYLNIVSEEDYAVGEEVLAIGTPLSLQFKHTVTGGIISAVDRTVKISDGGSLDGMIQHDASINPGNSGGPLINLSGEVIGVNTLKVDMAEGIGFALPARIAEPIISRINAGEEEISVVKLGLSAGDAAIAMFNGEIEEKAGVYVKDVKNKSILRKVGLKNGDIITEIDGEKVENIIDLRIKVLEKKYGDTITITFIRNGEEFKKDVELTL